MVVIEQWSGSALLLQEQEDWFELMNASLPDSTQKKVISL